MKGQELLEAWLERAKTYAPFELRTKEGAVWTVLSIELTRWNAISPQVEALVKMRIGDRNARFFSFRCYLDLELGLENYEIV